MEVQHGEIPFGLEHHTEMSRFLGVKDYCELEPFNYFALFGSYRHDYVLPGGRVASVHTTDHGFSSKVDIFPDHKSYDIVMRNERLTTQDPEGRGGRNMIGQKIQWVQLWMSQHPGERVPESRSEYPELWHYDPYCKKCLEGKELHMTSST